MDRQQRKKIAGKAIRHIAEHPADRGSAKHLAEQLEICETTLRTCVKEELGESIGEYRHRVRLENAADLLANGRLNVTRAAEAGGYESGEALAKAFHPVFRCSPLEFRKANPGLCPTFPSVSYRHAADPECMAGKTTVVANLPGGHCTTMMYADARLEEQQMPGYELGLGAEKEQITPDRNKEPRKQGDKALGSGWLRESSTSSPTRQPFDFHSSPLTSQDQ